MQHNSVMADLGAEISDRHSSEAVKQSKRPVVVTPTDRDADIDLLCDIPAFLDLRIPEVREAWAQRCKDWKENERKQRFLQPAPKPQTFSLRTVEEIEKAERKAGKKERLTKGIDVLLSGLKRGDVVSGRKLKAKFLEAVQTDDALVELDYERCVRRLCKERRLWRSGRSYERRS